MSEVESLEVIAKKILSSYSPQFRFLIPELLDFDYDTTRNGEPYFAQLTGIFTNIRQAQFEAEPIDHLHAKSLPFICEQLAYVLAAKLILERKVPGLESRSLFDISREKKEILRAAKLTYTFADIPLADNTQIVGWIGLQDKPYLPTPQRVYSGRMDLLLHDVAKPDVVTKANYHVVRVHK